MSTKKNTEKISLEEAGKITEPVETSEKETEAKATAPDTMEIIAQMQATIASLQAQLANANKVASMSMGYSPEVTLVYLSESLGVITTDNLTLNCTKYGEQFIVSRTQFDVIVGKYRRWFDEGILAVGDNNVDIAAAKGLRAASEFNLSPRKLESIGSMTADELKKLWNSLNSNSQKESIVYYFKRKFIENQDVRYRDAEKIDLLDRLTKGGFKREKYELSGDNLKITPKDLMR